MKINLINSPQAYNLNTGYAQAVEVTSSKRTLYISGQIPVRPDGTTPEDFIAQAQQAWANVEAQLKSANMRLENIIKHTTYLSDRRYRDQNREVRQEVFGPLSPALTVIITDIFEETWLLEIEAIAMA